MLCKISRRTAPSLTLCGNNLRDAFATALADALQATVLTCCQQLFRAWFTGCCRCRFTKWCERLACCCFCVYSCFLEGNLACRGVLFASCSQVDVGTVQKRIGHIESLAIGISLVAERHHITSSGPWPRLGNIDRDVSSLGVTWRGMTLHRASRKKAGLWIPHRLLQPERT